MKKQGSRQLLSATLSAILSRRPVRRSFNDGGLVAPMPLGEGGSSERRRIVFQGESKARSLARRLGQWGIPRNTLGRAVKAQYARKRFIVSMMRPEATKFWALEILSEFVRKDVSQAHFQFVQEPLQFVQRQVVFAAFDAVQGGV